MTIITTIEQDAVILWDDFLKGIHWLSKEAQAVAAVAVHLDPAIQVQLQALLTTGEQAASALASEATGALTNIVATGAGDIETVVANFLSAALGGIPKGANVTAAAVDVLKAANAALQAAVPVAVGKIVGAIVTAAVTP